MIIKEFKLIKNRQRPEFCYSYEKQEGELKYSIFTMNGGKTFFASIEKFGCTQFSETHISIKECLKSFKTFNN